MNMNKRLQLVSILPVVLSLSIVFFMTQYQYKSLSEQATKVYKDSVIKHRKKELHNYLSIAHGAIEHLYHNDAIDEVLAQNLVKEILANMLFTSDGYFFAYDYDGNNLVLPGQEWRIGTNMIDLQDENGVMIIQELIKNARNGGGYVNYVFNQPSKGGLVGKKIAYSEPLDKWGWVIGTGAYIDDIDEQISLLSDSIEKHIDQTSQITLHVGIFSLFAVFLAGMFIRMSEKRLADKKLRVLNERIFQTQEEECKRVSRELHDGISQTVAATQFSLEAVHIKNLKGVDSQKELEHAMTMISKVMADIRCISHQLHPGILEDYGLGAALDELGQEFTQRTNIKVSVQRLAVRNILTTELKSALYRITQEAFTNIERHSGATEVKVSLFLKDKWLVLKIEDNGCGFNSKNYESVAEPSEGIGLRNMKERLHFYSGKFDIISGKKGTTILASIPKSELHYTNVDTSKSE